MAKNASYIALARKYRPQAFADVLGQPAVSVTLKNALASKRVHHAYLFTGPRGVGKTTMARLLAKALNCAQGPGPEPCGACDPCREIAASSCLDVLEMDAASHTGVDNIREVIIDTVALAPNRDRYKVFIIDEAHMLSAAAFNALLKTLEEPPPHVVFVLATTESAKIPATIASRCQRFKFRPIPVESLREHLADLASREKIPAEPEALDLLARSAEGSLRDAISLLDQCRSFTEQGVTAQLVRDMFGFVPEEMLQGLARALVAADAAALANLLRQAYEEGVEPAQLLKDLRAGLQGAYLGRLGLAERADQSWDAALAGAAAEHLRFLLERVNKTLEDLRFGDSPRLVLELGLFGCLEAAGDLSAWVKRLEELERRLAGAAPAPAAPAPVRREEAASPGPAREKNPVPPAPQLGSLWSGLLAALREDKPSLAAVLESARPAVMPDGSWKIVCARAFDMEQARRGLDIISAKLAALSGKKIPVSLEVGAAKMDGGEIADAGVQEQSGAAPEAGVWKDVAEPDKKTAKEPSPLSRAEKILGGTARFIKKKPAP